ncbi:MAG TPA: SLBB domain-containing protein [Gemmatimonadaceae bacterium]|nr:SLBB domain-containing protein [Gemmatimonadaceae bacterium]
MFATKARLLIAAALVSLATTAQAQRPSPAEAQRILESNPQLVEQLRQRVMSSGLTPDQVRARLRAEGYPETLLDAYLGSAAGEEAVPDQDVFAAVSALGLADTTDVLLIQCGIDPDSIAMAGLATRSAADTLQTGALRSDTSTAAGRARVDATKRMLLPACRARLDSIARGDLRSRVEVDSGFVIFGLETFRRQTTLFDPNLTGPVDANYRVGPGDMLVLVLTGDVEAAYQLEVNREGAIVVPQVGQMSVNNLTLSQIETLLYTRLGRVYSGVRRGPGATTRFSISPARLRSNQIFVHGDVMRPGSHRVSSAGTAMGALYAAGGPTDDGSLRQVEIRRGGRLVEVLDVYDYLIRGDASRDVRLQNGDVVFVPIHGPRVRIVGEVSRPATYELKAGETMQDAIRFAGGLKPTASRQRIQVERILPPEMRSPGRERVVVDVAADGPDGRPAAAPMFGGDVVRVFPVTERVANRVTVRGNVWSPGTQGIQPGVTRLSDVLRAAGGVRPDTYLGQVLVSRVQADSTRYQLRATLADTLGNVVDDIAIAENDEIHVFSRSEFREPMYVAITGAVNRSGRFHYREGMTVRDLVLLAGGLKQNALLSEAEVARLPQDRTGGRTAETFRVPLDSSYMTARSFDGRYIGPPGLPASRGEAADVLLLPYDNVLILEQPDWELQRTVSVYGEVRYPGRYALRNKNERVGDLIARAGGLNREAHADGIVFYRAQNGTGRIGIELPQVLRNQRHRDNLILQDGDSLFLPRYSGVVHVDGAVNAPVAVSYVPGQNIEYYLRAAGGPTAKADASRAYVTQPNGKVEAVVRRSFAPDAIPRPRAGGRVYVPERDTSIAAPNYLGLATTLIQIVTGLVTAIAVARSL